MNKEFIEWLEKEIRDWSKSAESADTTEVIAWYKGEFDTLWRVLLKYKETCNDL